MEYSAFRSEKALSQKYCAYFKLVYIFFGVLPMILIVIATLYMGLTKSKPFGFYLASLIGILSYYFIYLQNKLLYDMCQNSLIM
jgi:hypothetical protein